MALGWIKLQTGYIRAQEHFANPDVLEEIAQAAYDFANAGRKYHPRDEEPEEAFSMWFLGFLKAADRLEGLLNPERLSFQHPDLKGHFSGPMDRSNALQSIRISLDATLKWLDKKNLCTIRTSSDAEMKGHEWAQVASPFPKTLTQPKARWWDVTTLAGDDLMTLVAQAKGQPNKQEYLGIVLLHFDLAASRIVAGVNKTAFFKRQLMPWKLFLALVESGAEGIHKDELMRRLGMAEKSEDALRGHKGSVETLVGEELRLTVEADGKGYWRVISLP